LRDSYADVQATGAEVVVVTMGTPEETQEFVQRRGPAPFPLLCDTERASYPLYGLQLGTFGQLLGPAVLSQAMQAKERGFRMSRPMGEPRQMPGTFVIDRGGVIRLAHYNRDAADHPAQEAILEALRGLRQPL